MNKRMNEGEGDTWAERQKTLYENGAIEADAPAHYDASFSSGKLCCYHDVELYIYFFHLENDMYIIMYLPTVNRLTRWN